MRSVGSRLFAAHYLDEAEQLADRVAVLRQGEIVALGTPRELTSRTAATKEIRYRRDGREVVMETHELTKTLHELTGEALAAGIELEGLQVLKPSLEDIYLDLTGRRGVSIPPAPVPGGATALLAKPRARVLHVHLPAAHLRAARLGIRRRRDRG